MELRWRRGVPLGRVNIYGALERDAGALARAEREAQRSVELADRAGDRFAALQATRILAEVELDRARFARATALADVVVAGASSAHPWLAPSARLVAAWATLEQGRPVEAAAQARAVRDQAVGLGEDALVVGAANLVWAATGAAADDPTGAADDWPWPERLDRRLLELTDLARRGAFDAVVHGAADLAVLADGVPLARQRIGARVLLADALLVVDEPHQAAVAYGQALRDAARGPYPVQLAEILDGLASLLLLRRSPDLAGACAGAAQAIRDRSGVVARARPWRDRLAAAQPGAVPPGWLDDHHGVRPAAVDAVTGAAERVTPGSGAGHPLATLTRAERRVVELVAEGLTNPQVGERLFISRRTVDAHLASVFRKLEVRTRTQLAALVTRAGSPDHHRPGLPAPPPR